jgi:hypothetical protein
MLIDFVNRLDSERLDYHLSKLSFFAFTKQLLTSYIDGIRAGEAGFDTLKVYPFTEIDFCEAALLIAETLLALADHALHEGLPDGVAYTQLATLMDQHVGDQTIFDLILRTSVRYVAPGELRFYRLRSAKTGGAALSAADLFHMPFNYRTRVSTNRFSLPGIPCLYLANSVYTAWRELDEPDEVAAVRFENVEPIQFLDVDGTRFMHRAIAATDQQQDEQLVLHALFLPFLFLTAQPVQFRDDAFKPEYILPQLLADVVRLCFPREFAGVSYRSTRLLTDDSCVGEFINYAVFPKNVYVESGYCASLCQTFRVSDPIRVVVNNDGLAPADIVPASHNIQYINTIGSRSAFAGSVFDRIEQTLSTKPVRFISP